MTLKKDEERERKNGPGVVSVFCAHLPELLVRGKKEKKTPNKLQKDRR